MQSLENKRKGRQLGSLDPETLSTRVSGMGQRDLGGREGQKACGGLQGATRGHRGLLLCSG